MKYDAAGVGANSCENREGIFVIIWRRDNNGGDFCGCGSEEFVFFSGFFPLLASNREGFRAQVIKNSRACLCLVKRGR